MRFSSPSASCRSWAATYTPGVPLPGLRYLLSVSHALEVLIRPSPAGLVSCRSRSWGFAFRGRAPLAELYVLSDAGTLLLLVTGLEMPETQLQGLAPRKSLCLDRLPPVRTAASIGFCLPEVFPCASWGGKRPALLDFVGDTPKWITGCPSEPSRRAVG